YVPCPGATGNAQRYLGQSAPYRCHSAVVDPIGDIVVLRQGGFTGTSSAFGYLHTLLDHNVDDHVIERVVSSAYPLTAPKGLDRPDVRLIAMEPEQVAELAAHIRQDYSPAALDPGVSEPTIVQAADGSRALVVPREQQVEPLRSMQLVDAAAVGATLVVTFTW